jgi:hypothetical protein
VDLSADIDGFTAASAASSLIVCTKAPACSDSSTVVDGKNCSLLTALSFLPQQGRIMKGKVHCSVVDPDSMGSLDPDAQSRSGSRRAKMTQKNRKQLINFVF